MAAIAVVPRSFARVAVVPRRSFLGRAIRAQPRANWEWMLVLPVIVACLGVGTALGLGWLAVLSLGVLVARDRSKGSDARYARTMAFSLLTGALFMLVAVPTWTLIDRDRSSRAMSRGQTPGHGPEGRDS